MLKSAFSKHAPYSPYTPRGRRAVQLGVFPFGTSARECLFSGGGLFSPDFRRRFRLSVIRLFMVLVSKEGAKRLLIPWF